LYIIGKAFEAPAGKAVEKEVKETTADMANAGAD
jgi:hypothetical protein